MQRFHKLHPPRGKSMSSPVLIVCERTGDWAVAWRSALAGGGRTATVTISESRSIDECRALLDEHSAAVAVIEITQTNFEAGCSLLADLERRWPRAAVMVVVDSKARAEAELPLREHGAQHVMSSRYELPSAVQLALRHFARGTSRIAPEPEPSAPAAHLRSST